MEVLVHQHHSIDAGDEEGGQQHQGRGLKPTKWGSPPRPTARPIPPTAPQTRRPAAGRHQEPPAAALLVCPVAPGQRKGEQEGDEEPEGTGQPDDKLGLEQLENCTPGPRWPCRGTARSIVPKRLRLGRARVDQLDVADLHAGRKRGGSTSSSGLNSSPGVSASTTGNRGEGSSLSHTRKSSPVSVQRP